MTFSFLLLFFLYLCLGMSSKEIYGNFKFQNVLFLFLIIFFRHCCNSEFINPLLGCFWNLWVTVDNHSDKSYINFCKEVYFRKLQINMIKDYVTHMFKDSLSFYILTDAQTIVKLVSACL